jgi:hypothetical protein
VKKKNADQGKGKGKGTEEEESDEVAEVAEEEEEEEEEKPEGDEKKKKKPKKLAPKSTPSKKKAKASTSEGGKEEAKGAEGEDEDDVEDEGDEVDDLLDEFNEEMQYMDLKVFDSLNRDKPWSSQLPEKSTEKKTDDWHCMTSPPWDCTTKTYDKGLGLHKESQKQRMILFWQQTEATVGKGKLAVLHLPDSAFNAYTNGGKSAGWTMRYLITVTLKNKKGTLNHPGHSC